MKTRHTPSEMPIAVSGLSKAYRRGSILTSVLDGVDLEVPRGRCVFLAGPSGSGKTTLLSILGCILTADTGCVRILGQELTRLSASARSAMRRDKIGFVFQRFQLIRGLNAVDNVSLPLVLRNVAQPRARQRAKALLEAVGLGDKLKAHPANLSTGQCQRVALARALVGNPELILADEPTASLDAASGQEVMRLLRQLTTDEGKTAIVVTHDPRIFSFADQILYLEGGRVRENIAPNVMGAKPAASRSLLDEMLTKPGDAARDPLPKPPETQRLTAAIEFALARSGDH